MPEENGIEPLCPFDLSEYRNKPVNSVASGRVDVRSLMEHVDTLYEKNDIDGARSFLEEYYEKALEFNDKEGQLGIISELLGCYRKTRSAENGLWAAEEAERLITELGLEGTVTAGTVWLNAATTMREFGKAAEAVRLYDMAARAFSGNLDPGDYRFAGLFNNYAACLEACGDPESVEEYYKRALSVVSRLKGCEVEEAVTYVNLACLYDETDPEDERIYECIRKAIDLFNIDHVTKDGYYAFNVLKCVDAIDHFGFFRDAKELRKRAEEIYGILQNS